MAESASSPSTATLFLKIAQWSLLLALTDPLLIQNRRPITTSWSQEARKSDMIGPCEVQNHRRDQGGILINLRPSLLNCTDSGASH